MRDKWDIFNAESMFPKKRKDTRREQQEIELAKALIRSEMLNNP